MTLSEENDQCMKCAACCKKFWIFTTDGDEALRFRWLQGDAVTVELVRTGLWRVVFNTPCKQLEEENGRYACKVHDGVRPGFCAEYPRNYLDKSCDPIIRVQEEDRCPLLKAIKRGN